ncbi:MAG: hypothetical protein IKA40_03130, partial [Clostridia bacterium]|nr:hypothetical protein [Clostridia bacterium]
FSAWYAEDGIHLAKGRSSRYAKAAQVISWESAAERIGQLMEAGQYATNVEVVEAEHYERTKMAETLWYMHRELTEEARERGLLETLTDYRRGGFPDATARLAEALKDPDFLQKVSSEYADFLAAYSEDRDLMRFHYHKVPVIGKELADLSLPRREYQSDMAEVPDLGRFITEDEIDATLTRGVCFFKSKNGRIYKKSAFFPLVYFQKRFTFLYNNDIIRTG